MNQLEKIQKIKKARLLQSIQSELEDCLMGYLYSASSMTTMNNIRNSMDEIIKKRTNYTPEIDITYDKDSYTFQVKMENVGLKIQIKNDGIELSK